MLFRDLRSFLEELERVGELARVTAELSPRYEVAAATRLVAQSQGKAVLFEKVQGYRVPVVSNLLGSTRRLALALGVREEDLPTAYLKGKNKPVKPKMVTHAPVQEVVISHDVDILRTIPVLTHHQRDAGAYFTCAFVVAKDPLSGIRGLGIHRIQVKGPDRVGIFLASPPLSTFLAKAEQQDKPLEIAIVCGTDPVMYFASPQVVPPGVDKYDLAGGLAKTPVELVCCKSVDLEVPAGAEFVLEGRFIPHQREKEGPFGESTGYYLTYDNPVAHIKTITHRASPIYHALVPFGGEEMPLQFPAYQTEVLVRLQNTLPFVRQVHSPALGVVYVQIEKQADEEPRRVMEALMPYGRAPYAKVVVVVDTDVDIRDPREMAWALGTRVKPDRNVVIKRNLPGLAIDPSTSGTEERGELGQLQTRTAKMGIDATKPVGEQERYEKVDVPAETKAKVRRLLGL